MAALHKFCILIRSTLQYSLDQGNRCSFLFMIWSHLLPNQLPGEYTVDIAPTSAFLFQCIRLRNHAVSAFSRLINKKRHQNTKTVQKDFGWHPCASIDIIPWCICTRQPTYLTLFCFINYLLQSLKTNNRKLHTHFLPAQPFCYAFNTTWHIWKLSIV